MKYFLLLLVAAILLGTIWRGWHRGFFKTLLSMFSLVLAVILMLVLSPFVGDIIMERTSLHSTTQTTIRQALETRLENEGMDEEDSEESILDTLHLPSILMDSLPDTTQGNYLDRISNRLADLVIGALSLVVTLVISLIIITILSLVFDIVGKIPVIGGMNHLAGALLGAVKGLIYLWLLCLVITVISPTAIGQEMLAAIGDNALLSAIYSGSLSIGGVWELGSSLLF